MNGAQALIRTLVDAGVDTCFMNPGTSEMHFVAALDDVPEMRGVLALFEGVATGAADGYARMAGRPAAVLLHLGPGLGNGLANLHNARKAFTPVVNIVGDHATYHKQYDAQLESDIETVARNVSSFIRTSAKPDEVAADAAAAVAAAIGPPGGVATLILPADVSWSEPAEPAAPVAPTVRRASDPDAGRGDRRRAALGRAGGAVRRWPGLPRRGAASTPAGSPTTVGAKLLCETFPARLERGAGVPPVERSPTSPSSPRCSSTGLRHLVLVDSKAPVSFFAYPGKDSYLVPGGLRGPHACRPGGRRRPPRSPRSPTPSAQRRTRRRVADVSRPELPTGALTAEAVCAAVGALMPEGAIVSDEGNTSALFAAGLTAGAPRHDWLCLTGGAIGQGLPVAVGAAVACPDRKVIALEADGSALYTLQSWWTMARERLDVTTIVFNNSSYAVLNMELNRVGVPKPAARRRGRCSTSAGRTSTSSPLATGLGVPATRATTAEEFVDQLRRGARHAGTDGRGGRRPVDRLRR